MFKGFNSPHLLRVAGYAMGAVIIGGIAVVAAASAAGMTLGFRSSSTALADDASLNAAEARVSTAVCNEFMQHFAVEIGKTQAEINAAFQRAIADTLADEVKAGRITQPQADTIKQRLANQTPCTLRGVKVPRAGIDAFMREYVDASAAALGVTEAQLRTDLQNGQTLSQVAARQKISEATFRTKLIAGLKPVLDKAVNDKKLTSAQEQAIMTRLQSSPLPLWNKPMKRKPPTTAIPTPKAA
jgi:hypothetical protein